MGQSSPSAHEPQRSAVQLEHVLELLNSEHIGLAEAVAEGPGHLAELVPRFFIPSLCSSPVGAPGHRYVHIEERTGGAGWLVLRSPTSVNLW